MCLAIPARVIEATDYEQHSVRVEVAGVIRQVNIGLVDDLSNPIRPGDWVLIHVGFAISRIDAAEAFETLRLLKELGAEYEDELAQLKASPAL